jgi:hypothetical protein
VNVGVKTRVGRGGKGVALAQAPSSIVRKSKRIKTIDWRIKYPVMRKSAGTLRRRGRKDGAKCTHYPDAVKGWIQFSTRSQPKLKIHRLSRVDNRL